MGNAAEHFVFVVGGDNRAAARGLHAPPTAAQIFAEVRLLKPAFVLWTGDAIYGMDDTPGEAEGEYAEFLATARRGATPVYNAPGNHEIFARPEMERLYEHDMGRLYGSFDYGNSHFIAIDTEEIGDKGGVSAKQLAWLEADLEANRNAAHRFAFMHHPVFAKTASEEIPDPATREALHKLFVRYGVKTVFQGHEHLYYRSEHDGISYLVSGGAGAPSDADPDEGGYQHYLLVSVDGDAVKITVLQPWRLFSEIGPAGSDGSRIGVLANYQNADLMLSLDLPEGALGADAHIMATSTYKGKAQSLPVSMTSHPETGMITAHVMAPKHRAVVVTLGPAVAVPTALTGHRP
jgi:hypothetical protein